MRIFEYFRKTLETYVFMQINLDGNCLKNININIYFLKHMLDHMIVNSSFNLNLIEINDDLNDFHHVIEDIGISIGYVLTNCLVNRNEILRYGFSYVILEDSLSRVIIDCSGRIYLNYILLSKENFYNNLNVNLFYDFFISLVNNFKINLYIENFYGSNFHHKIETIFKAFGKALKISVKKNYIINSTKGILF